MSYSIRIAPNDKVDLNKIPTNQDGGLSKEEGLAKLEKLEAEIGELLELLFAAGQTGLLIVLHWLTFYGSIKVSTANKELDLRVSVLPTNHGQSVVMRLLDKDSIKVSLKQLGMAEDVFRTEGQCLATRRSDPTGVSGCVCVGAVWNG